MVMGGTVSTATAAFNASFTKSFNNFSLRGLLSRLGGGSVATKPVAPTRGWYFNNSMGLPRQPARSVAPLDVSAVAAGLVAAGAAPVGTPVEPPRSPKPLGSTEREAVMKDLLARAMRAVGHVRHASNRFRFDGFAGVHADRLYFNTVHLVDALVSETREYEADLLLGAAYSRRLHALRARLEGHRADLEAARAAAAVEPVAVTDAVVVDVAEAAAVAEVIEVAAVAAALDAVADSPGDKACV